MHKELIWSEVEEFDHLMETKKEEENFLEEWNIIKNIIVNWYTIKYPYDEIDCILSENYSYFIIVPNEYDYRNVVDLRQHMGYLELMFRIPKKLHPLIECWYKGKNGYYGSNIISGDIYLSHTNNVVKKHFLIEKHDGHFIELDETFDIKLTPYIDDLVNTINKDNYDIQELLEITNKHNKDLKSRKLQLESVAINLINNSQNEFVGYVRAKKFIDDFNKYFYNLDLSYECIDKYMIEFYNNSYYELEEFMKKIKYICNFLDKKKNSDSVEEFGLSFKTLSFLKKNNIKEVKDLHGKTLYDIFQKDSIFNIMIPHRDKIMLNKMISMANQQFDIEKLKDSTKYEKSLKSKDDSVNRSKVKRRLFKHK